MPDRDDSTLLERILSAISSRIIGGVAKSAERLVKRALRLLAMALAGVLIASLGISFIAVGAVKWLANLMPSWLAWAIVGIVLLLLGIVLMLGALLSSRS